MWRETAGSQWEGFSILCSPNWSESGGTVVPSAPTAHEGHVVLLGDALPDVLEGADLVRGGEGEACLQELSLENFHEAIRVGMVVDTVGTLIST